MESTKINNYRFSGGGYKCPYCFSKRGWSFLRNFGREYGQCFSCGTKHFPVKDNVQQPLFKTQENERTASSKYIDTAVVQKTLKCYLNNPFIQFLQLVFGKTKTYNAIQQFKIGTAKNAGTVFWYFDKAQNPRKPKIIYYSSNGKRIKDKQPSFGGYTNDKGFTLCLFGEHQLIEKYYPADTPIILVESEKTACIGFMALPQYVWLAIGGGRINHERAMILSGRKIIILPDADEAGRKGAESTSLILNNLKITHKILDLFPSRNDKVDLADHIISLYQSNNTDIISKQIPLANPLSAKKKAKVELLFQKNPVFWDLTEKLGLVIQNVLYAESDINGNK